MNRIIASILLVLGFSSFCIAQDVIMSPTYKQIKAGTDPKADFSTTKNQIQVIFPKPAAAKAELSKLVVTTKGEDPTNLAAQVKGKQLTGSKSMVILFDLKGKLPVSDFKLGFLENGKALGKLYAMTFNATTPAANNSGGSGSSGSGSTPTLQVVHYYPIPVPAGRGLTAFTAPAEANISHIGMTEVNPDNRTKKSSTNLTYVFSGKDYNHTYWDGKLPSHLRVNQKLSIILNPVPNPLRYTVKINNSFVNFNTSTDSTLEKLLLNPWNLLGKNLALSGTDADRKRKALGYLQEVNAKLTEYMDSWQTIDGIDPADFKTKKEEIKKAINDYLGSTAAGLEYPGDIPDFLVNEFEASDSLYLKPFIKTYQAFLNLNVTETRNQLIQVPNADEMVVKIQILPKTSITTALQTDTGVNLNIPVFGGFKVDVSPGIFYSFFHKNIYNLKSDSTAVTTGGITTYNKFKTIVTEKQPGGNVGFSTLMHFYGRWTRDVNFALGVGAGLTLESKPQVRYLVGGSILFGRENRLALSGGYSFGNVDMISSQYTNNRTVNTDTSVVTYKELQGGAFIALSYNIPILKRKSSK
jgi:hypothetical protein